MSVSTRTFALARCESCTQHHVSFGSGGGIVAQWGPKSKQAFVDIAGRVDEGDGNVSLYLTAEQLDDCIELLQRLRRDASADASHDLSRGQR